jgi:tRNA pseudouridine55 synthase
LNGFLNINKPEGITSFDVIRILRKLLLPRKNKVGHLGTLDPMAGGVLPIAVGHATRVIQFIDDNRKEYIAEMNLGGISDTLDAWGDIKLTNKISYQIDELESILRSFKGVIQQIPPMFSAVHHSGKRLYELARQGITVDRQPREVEIFSLEILQINNRAELPVVTIKIVCSRGTYIRTLCHDIGNRLGTGAFMSKLVRNRSGIFQIDDSVKLENLRENPGLITDFILPVDYPLQYMYNITVNDIQENSIINGEKLVINKIMPEGYIRVYSPESVLIVIAECKPDNQRSILKPLKVFKKRVEG